MQKNTKAKKSRLEKAAFVIFGAAVASGAAIGYVAPYDANGDGAIDEPFERYHNMVLYGLGAGAVACFSNAAMLHVAESRANDKNSADAYGHVKTV